MLSNDTVVSLKKKKLTQYKFSDLEIIFLIGGFLREQGFGYIVKSCSHQDKYLPSEVIEIRIEVKVKESE